eukprot:gene7400-527_t
MRASPWPNHFLVTTVATSCLFILELEPTTLTTPVGRCHDSAMPQRLLAEEQGTRWSSTSNSAGTWVGVARNLRRALTAEHGQSLTDSQTSMGLPMCQLPVVCPLPKETLEYADLEGGDVLAKLGGLEYADLEEGHVPLLASTFGKSGP